MNKGVSKKPPQIALIGSRGIPASYGGSEIVTEELALRLTARGYQVFVSCESRKFFSDQFKGITRVHSPSIEGKTITIPTLNDFIATLHIMIRFPSVRVLCYTNFDISVAAIIPRLFGKKVITNTDGIEWKRPIMRSKYMSRVWKPIGKIGSLYIKFMERLATRLANTVIADSQAIKSYLEESYNAKNVVFIPYGARILLDTSTSVEKENTILSHQDLTAGRYYLTVARIVAENNIDKEISGFVKSASSRKLVIVGNFSQKDGYTRYLNDLKGNDPRIVFYNAIYDKEILGVLRKNCFVYIHPYELGGTNPSLLEQMLFGRPIIANDVPFHREILKEGGTYYKTDSDLAERVNNLESHDFDQSEINEIFRRRIKEEYNWPSVSTRYIALFTTLSQKRKYER
jgi:rhamnosyltransferase